MTEKVKEFNNKYLLMRHLLLSLDDINKMNDHEINIMVDFINKEINK
jgi:hypothetical protein